MPCWLHLYVGNFSFTSSVTFIFIWEVLCGEFLLHIPCSLHFYLGSFSYTSRAGFFFFFSFFISCCLYFSAWSFSYTSRVACIFIWEGLGAEFLLHIPCWLRIWIVSLTYPLLALFLSGEFLPNNLCWLHFLSGEFLLHIPCWLCFYVVSLCYTSRVTFIFIWEGLCGEFLLHIPCWLCFYVVSLCYTSRVTFIFIWEGLCGEFLLHIPCCLHFYLRRFMWEVSLTHPVLPSFLSGKVYVGSFSYTSRVAFIFIWEGLCGEFLLHIPCWLRFSFTLGVSLTHPVLVSFFSFLFYPDSFPYISPAGFLLIWGVSPKQPMLASFLSGEFLLHIPCWLCFYVVSLSYTSRVTFMFIWEGLCGEFLLHIPCCLHLYLGRFMWGVSLTHPVLFIFFFFSFLFFSGVSLTYPMLDSFSSWEFFLHIPCWL